MKDKKSDASRRQFMGAAVGAGLGATLSTAYAAEKHRIEMRDNPQQEDKGVLNEMVANPVAPVVCTGGGALLGMWGASQMKGNENTTYQPREESEPTRHAERVARTSRRSFLRMAGGAAGSLIAKPAVKIPLATGVVIGGIAGGSEWRREPEAGEPERGLGQRMLETADTTAKVGLLTTGGTALLYATGKLVNSGAKHGTVDESPKQRNASYYQQERWNKEAQERNDRGRE